MSSELKPRDENTPESRSGTRKLKVCHVVATTDGGTWMFEQLKGLRDEFGFEVAAVISGDQGPLVDKLRSENIPFYVANFDAGAGAPAAILRMPFTILKLARTLRRERFDIVQTHIFKSMVVGRPAAWIADVPVRLAMIAGPFHLEAHSSRWIERLSYWMDTKLIPASEFSRTLCRDLRIPDERMAPTVYYSADADKFDPTAIRPANIRAEFNWDPNTPVIAHVAYFYPRLPKGRWVPNGLHGRGVKGHGDVVRAAAIVLREFPSAKFLFVGAGWSKPGQEYFAEIKELVRNMQLENSVFFAGLRTDANQILRDSDITLQPSLSENCGGSIEALLMERPMVATRVGGLVDTIRDQETGVLVRPSDPEDLARGILDLLRNPEKARAMARAGRKLMLERFTLRHTVADLAALYQDLTTQAKSKRAPYNPLVSVLRLIAGGPIFAYMFFRLLALDIYFPILVKRLRRAFH